MTTHEEAISSAMVAANLDPRNRDAKKTAEALVAAYIEGRSGEAVAWRKDYADEYYKYPPEFGADPQLAEIWRGHPSGFTVTPLFAVPSAGGETVKALTWTKVPDEPPLSLLKSINIDNQVLAYENGRYYNAWFEYEPSEGGWFWTDEADSEPNPSHYCELPAPPIPSSETRKENGNGEGGE